MSSPVVLNVVSEGSWIEVVQDGQVRRVQPGEVLLELEHGTHEVLVRAGGGLRSTAEELTTITVDDRAPAVSLSARSRTVEQGHTLPFVLSTDEAATLSLTFLDRDRPLYPVNGQHRALIGVPIRQEPGIQPATLTATDALGNTVSHTIDIEITAVDWPFTGPLKLSRKKASVPKPAIVKMRAERDPVYAEHTPDALWTGSMRTPTEGRHTSFFGSYRQYPDGHRSHHDAQDIANKSGTTVLSANAGVVRIARMQAVHGNAILLAHGQGVVTLYSHLSALHVKEGDTVTAGQHIGDMGTTGRSTGPHLHWGIVVDHVPVDPMQWTEDGFDRFDDLELLPVVPSR